MLFWWNEAERKSHNSLPDWLLPSLNCLKRAFISYCALPSTFLSSNYFFSAQFGEHTFSKELAILLIHIWLAYMRVIIYAWSWVDWLWNPLAEFSPVHVGPKKGCLPPFTFSWALAKFDFIIGQDNGRICSLEKLFMCFDFVVILKNINIQQGQSMVWDHLGTNQL